MWTILAIIYVYVQKNNNKYKQNGGQLTVTDRYGIYNRKT